MRRLVLVTLCALLLTPTGVSAQALPNVSLARVRYSTRKATVKPDGPLKTEIDAVDAAIAEATRLGHTGEVRRQLARGITLLEGRAWTPVLDLEAALVLRAERTIVDPRSPYAVRLEQIYRPVAELTPALSVVMRLERRAAVSAPQTAPPALTLVRELGVFDGVSRDLRESPFAMEVDLSSVADGTYVLEAELRDGTAALAMTSLQVVVHHGLDAHLRALESAALTAPPSVRADLRYPADYIRRVNLGRVTLGNFNLVAELAAADVVAAGARGGKDPFATRTGDFERHHWLDGANEVMPYRVYVPTTYAPSRALPLVIALHGLGGTEDSFFESYATLTPKLAEQHGFLLAAPLGYRVDGFYGSPLMGASDVTAKRRSEYSERDVLEVLRLMKAHYKVDESRIYLLGHSMGAIGVWALAAKYPEVWAAAVPFSGVGSPLLAERMKAIPQFVVHGDADPTVNVNGSRVMVAALQKLEAPVTYVEVPGGNHTDVVVPHLPQAFAFMAGQRKTAATNQQ